MPKPTLGTLFAALALWLTPLGADPIPTEIRLSPQQGQALFELAEQVRQGNETQQRDFAWLALSELLAAYEGEAETSRQASARDPEARRKLSRWRSATWAFSDQLRRRLEALENGAEVQVYARHPNPVMIAVDGQPTVISGPQASDDRRLEARILGNYCLLHACETTPKPEPVRTGTAKRADPSGQWEYRQNRRPQYTTGDGLVFEFNRLDGAQTAGAAAERLIAELRELAAQLRGVRSLGTAVDWDKLRLLPRDAPNQHWVLLNPNGDYLRASLPRLYRNPELLREAGPWLSAQAAGEAVVLLIRAAERFTHPIGSGLDHLR